MLGFIRIKIDELENLARATLPELRKGVAVDLPLTPTAWTAFHRDLFPALVSTGDGGLLVAKLTNFYRVLELTQSTLNSLVEERRRLWIPSRWLPRKIQTAIADTIERVLGQADEIGPLVEAQTIAWRDGAAALRRDLDPKGVAAVALAGR